MVKLQVYIFPDLYLIAFHDIAGKYGLAYLLVIVRNTAGIVQLLHEPHVNEALDAEAWSWTDNCGNILTYCNVRYKMFIKKG